MKGREAILKVHARKVKMAGYVDLHVIAKATVGITWPSGLCCCRTAA